MYYDHSTYMYYDHSTCMYYDHSTCMYYEHSTCIYYEHSTYIYYGHSTCIMSSRAHVPWPLRRGGVGGFAPWGKQGGFGAASAPMAGSILGDEVGGGPSMNIVRAFIMIIVHTCTMVIVHVSCPTGLMFPHR